MREMFVLYTRDVCRYTRHIYIEVVHLQNKKNVTFYNFISLNILSIILVVFLQHEKLRFLISSLYITSLRFLQSVHTAFVGGSRHLSQISL